MNLSNTQSGLWYFIKDIKVHNPKLLKRLEALGFFKGERILVVSNWGGFAIIKIKDSKIALNNKITKFITVKV